MRPDGRFMRLWTFFPSRTLRQEISLAVELAIAGFGCVTSIAPHMARAGVVGEILIQDIF